MITSSRSPISVTSVVRSSSTHGDSRLLTRVHSCVSPSSISLPTLTRPARAASLRSTGTASSRLPSRMSTVGAMSGTLATIFSFEKSRKWIIREGLNGISRIGSGAPIASGLPKSRGFRISQQYSCCFGGVHARPRRRRMRRRGRAACGPASPCKPWKIRRAGLDLPRNASWERRAWKIRRDATDFPRNAGRARLATTGARRGGAPWHSVRP